MKALLRLGTASALVLTTALAGGAFAQDAQTTTAAPAATTDAGDGCPDHDVEHHDRARGN